MITEREFYAPREAAVRRVSAEYRHLLSCSGVGPDYDQCLDSAWNAALRQLHPFYSCRFDGPAVMVFGAPAKDDWRAFHKWKLIGGGEWFDDFECELCGEKETCAPDQRHSSPYADGCAKGTINNTNGAAYELAPRRPE